MFERRPLEFALSCAAVCLAALSLQGAAANTQARSVDLNIFVARHVSAIGGEAALQRLRDFKLRLMYTEGSFSAPSSLAQARPYYRLVEVPDGPITKDSILEGYDGSAWEYYGDPGVVLRTVGGAGLISRRNAHQFIDPLVDAAANGTMLAYVRDSTMDHKYVLVISARFTDGSVENIFVDKSTYLIDGIEQDTQLHAFGKAVTTHIEMDDYRRVGDVLMPFRTRQIDNATGRIIDSSVTTSAGANIGLNPSDFAPPRFTRTPIQAMLEAIYEEREDPVAVLQTYHDYRASHGGNPSTLDAVDFIGFQCLKMGDAKSAIALLTANISDYPGSASAHFGLGRALASAGEFTAAKAQFERALEIDPKYKRAAEALAALPAQLF